MSDVEHAHVRMSFVFVNGAISDDDVYEYLSHTHALSMLHDPIFQRGLEILRQIKAQVRGDETAWRLLVHDTVRRECQWHGYSLNEGFPGLLDPAVMQHEALILLLLEALGLEEEHQFLADLGKDDNRFIWLEGILENSSFLDSGDAEIDLEAD